MWKELSDGLTNEGWTVLCIGEGKKGVEVIKTNPIDIVLLEIKLPDMDGVDVIQQIKTLNNKIIVIIITADGSKEIIIQLLQLKVDDYLEKPIDIKNLKTRIRSLLELRDNPYNFRKYPLDLNNRFDKVKELLKITNGNHKLYEVANKVALSPKHLSRIFKENNGKSFTEFRLQIRMEYAKYLLQNTNFRDHEMGSDMHGYNLS